MTAHPAPLGAPLELQNLRLTYNGVVKAVDDVSLSVAAGEFVSLLGPSGSGKTTTLKMLAGFEDADSGDILMGGRSIARLDPSKRNIGMVFQNYALFPHMTVAENVAFPLKMRKRPAAEIKKAVDEALDLVRLTPLAGRKPGQLSGGQQQRVAFARAIVFRPPLLLMDEPLGALDRQLRKEVQTELKRVHRQLGLTVIYVTHDQEEALFLSDRIAVMAGGKIAQIGAPPELYENPQSRFVAEFLGEAQYLSARYAPDASGPGAVLADGIRIAGRVVGPAPEAGAPVDVLIRPEKYATGPGTNGDSRLAATITQVHFMGPQIEYELETAGGPTILRSYLRAGAQPLGMGTRLTLNAAPRDCMIFAAGRP